MPNKPRHFCYFAGCRELVEGSYCEKHQKIKDEKTQDRRRRYDQTRPAYYAWYDTARWKAIRQAVLFAMPFCRECEKTGRVSASTVVDHKIPHVGNQKLFWDLSNLQGLCASCHSIKTSKEESWNMHTKVQK